ncbi:hypothetical protein CEXT_26571 [Caerostris extrusa]|uniref:Uncharacterized protein n=1 Tax=Caerostris extrusa TaxID=172846 RepID=A0AAV4N7R8_CAEEX|nr:hypothetical protein CEXT_26571 [Caerostris extrusa]
MSDEPRTSALEARCHNFGYEFGGWHEYSSTNIPMSDEPRTERSKARCHNFGYEFGGWHEYSSTNIPMSDEPETSALKLDATISGTSSVDGMNIPVPIFQ